MTLIIVEDTRNQINKHKKLNDDLNNLGCKVIRSKLYVGDYSLLNDMTICVDTKKDWNELASNICGKQHSRFRAECIRAKENNIQLVILIESEENVFEWQSNAKKKNQKVSSVNPQVLYKAMQTMSEKYNVLFINCSKAQTAKLLVTILKKEQINAR